MERITNSENIAVAILNWNGKHWLEKFLPSVVAHSHNAKIYVIDNNSTDDSIAFLQSNFPRLKIIINEENYGFAKGYNEGLKYVEEEIFCLLNSDVEVTENWLQPFIELFSSNENIVAAQPKIISYNNKDYFEFAGAAGGFIDNLGFPFCRGRVFFHLEKDENQYNDSCEIFWATGACFFIRRKDFLAENGFDNYFFAHMEEIDLCWRLKNSGKKIYYCANAKVYHVGGGTLNINNPQKTYLNFRNNLLMLIKNLPSKSLFPVLFLRLCLDGIAAIEFLFRNGFGHFFAVFRAHISMYRKFSTYYRMRKNTNTQYYQKTFIVLKYFIFKMKKFKDL